MLHIYKCTLGITRVLVFSRSVSPENGTRPLGPSHRELVTKTARNNTVRFLEHVTEFSCKYATC